MDESFHRSSPKTCRLSVISGGYNIGINSLFYPIHSSLTEDLTENPPDRTVRKKSVTSKKLIQMLTN